MFKFLALTLVFLSITSFASTVSPVDKTHPFLKIGKSIDNTASVYIGAYGDMLPEKTKNGDVILIAMITEDIADAAIPKGAQYEYAIAANCDQQLAKILIFWEKADENSPGISSYNLTGNALSDKITEELNKQPVNTLSPNSLITMAVSSACHYLGMPIKPPQRKKREWSA